MLIINYQYNISNPQSHTWHVEAPHVSEPIGPNSKILAISIKAKFPKYLRVQD